MACATYGSRRLVPELAVPRAGDQPAWNATAAPGVVKFCEGRMSMLRAIGCVVVVVIALCLAFVFGVLDMLF
jgi:hypothetical protein